MRLNPLSAGRSFQTKLTNVVTYLLCLNPLSAGRSFQTSTLPGNIATPTVLIPYQQGGLFRLKPTRQEYLPVLVLIPYQQGGLFRPDADAKLIKKLAS